MVLQAIRKLLVEDYDFNTIIEDRLMMWTKLVDRKDWEIEPLASLIREAFSLSVLRHPNNVSPPLDSKLWENAVAVHVLSQLRTGSNILGVGAGMEVTSFMLANRGYNVFPTDIYLSADQWDEPALRAFALNPELVFPGFSRERIYPINLDARFLPFPDNYFDGVYSSGSLEHFGNVEDITQSLREMIRVTKVGHKISISTEFRVDGPNNEITWDPTVYLFSREFLEDLFSNLDDVTVLGGFDSLEPRLITSTESITELVPFLNGEKAYLTGGSSIYPNLLMSHEGFKFCSFHLEIEKVKHTVSVKNYYYRKLVNNSDAYRFSNVLTDHRENKLKEEGNFSNHQIPLAHTENRLRARLMADLNDAVDASQHYAVLGRSRNRRIIAKLLKAVFRAARFMLVKVIEK